MVKATRDEIVAYMSKVPNSHESWIDIFLALGLPISALDKFVQTMVDDDLSPLKLQEDSALSQEIVKLNGVFGELTDGDRGNGHTIVRINAVMTTAEASRVSALVSNFCQPDIRTSGRFHRNGHIVMNGVRRCTAGYQVSKIPAGAKIVEVGPDVRNWITDQSAPDWKVNGKERYVGARPRISQRDVVRTQWEELALRVKTRGFNAGSEQMVDRAGQLLESYDDIFPNAKVEFLGARGEYILSNDANYDITFADMPSIMVSCGARAWYGTMLRVKGLTRYSKKIEGSLPLMGVNYRVDWKAGRIDFRHPKCNAFGYSHGVHELMKYEEYNGYVWTTDRANYIYAKGPETNDELLFFSVVRVVKALYLVQPSYVESPEAGRMRVKSVWAVGGWDNTGPTRFEPIEFCVDPLAFGKIYEKRRALDSKGDFSNTLVFVRSTSVRMWLNGTPVGANKKIESSLAEATAVAIEVLVSQSRLRTDMVFSEAMKEYQVAVSKGNWMYRLLESVVDFKAVCGTVIAPFAHTWGTVRGTVADFALSSLSGLSVSVGVVSPHIRMSNMGVAHHINRLDGDPEMLCTCVYDRMVNASRALDGSELAIEPVRIRCSYCQSVVDDMTEEPDVTEASSTLVSEEESVVETEEKQNEWQEPEQVVVTEEDSVKGWRGEAHVDRPERKAMEEMIFVETYLKDALMTEIRIDSNRIAVAKCLSDAEVMRFNTGRVQHSLVQFQRGKLHKVMGTKLPEFGAIYDIKEDRVHVTRVLRNGLVTAKVKDGWYYTCNMMKVWNTDEIIAAVSHALDYGVVKDYRALTEVTLGVFGAGKTYSMMKRVAEEYLATGVRFLVISVTGKAAREALEYGVKFGIPRKVCEARCKTVDSYLINGKFPAELVVVDEFPMAHEGRIDGAISLAGPNRIRMCGDGRQIPYDPFTAELELHHSTLAGQIPEERIVFLPMTHRARADVCAAFLEMYPEVYPCNCCRVEEKNVSSMSVRRIGGISDVEKRDNVRYHTFKQSERDMAIEGLHLKEGPEGFKLMVNSGIGTVHQDQGSTHRNVECLRLDADYDKKSNERNPSLYNRLNYVLTDMTRHTGEYVYSTASEERDMVCKRVAIARDPIRLKLVAERKGMGLSTVSDMLANRYHTDIVSGASML